MFMLDAKRHQKSQLLSLYLKFEIRQLTRKMFVEKQVSKMRKGVAKEVEMLWGS